MMSTRRDALVQALGAVPPETKLKWQSAFREFDIEKNNTISVEELRQVMAQKLCMAPKAGEVEAMVAAVDLDGDGVINYEEFELMMVASGRDTGSGFAHVVERILRLSEIAVLVTREANNFVHNFCQQHRGTFAGLAAPDAAAAEPLPAYYDTWQMFKEEGELMLQSALLLWGTAQMKSFEPEFLDELNRTGISDSFLKYLDYPAFMQKMHDTVTQPQQCSSDQHPAAAGVARPQTPVGNGSVQKRLAELDYKLTQLDYQRNQLLAERRRLVGCEVDSITTGALKQQLEMVQYREDVGND